MMILEMIILILIVLDNIEHQKLMDEISVIKSNIYKNIVNHYNSTNLISVDLGSHPSIPMVKIIPYEEELYNLLLHYYKEKTSILEFDNIHIMCRYYVLTDFSEKTVKKIKTNIKNKHKRDYIFPWAHHRDRESH